MISSFQMRKQAQKFSLGPRPYRELVRELCFDSSCVSDVKPGVSWTFPISEGTGDIIQSSGGITQKLKNKNSDLQRGPKTSFNF